MLVEFSVGNYRSFKDMVTFSMVASAGKELEETHVFPVKENLRLLKSAMISGANASGKSNLFKAMAFMKKFVLESSKETQATDRINVINFKLNTETENEPSFFEIVFIHENIRYRYGFQIDQKEVHKEWLFFVPIRKETTLFVREKNNYELGASFKEGKGLTEKVRPNALFLSVVAQFNGPISIDIIKWFNNFKIVSGLNDELLLNFTLKKFEDEATRKEILNFIKVADLGIEDIIVNQMSIPKGKVPFEVRDEVKNELYNARFAKIDSFHKKFDKEGNFAKNEGFNFFTMESEGTKKIFAISAPVIATLKNGYVLVIDEFDARLHPLLSRFLLSLFNSKETNPSNAQLIFVSHDTDLLNKNFLRRDQIWFTEKNKASATNLFSLVEYRIRKDASFEKDYLLGKYGAIPFIDETIPLIREKKNGD